MKGAADTYEGRGLIADPIHQYILYTRPGGIPGEETLIALSQREFGLEYPPPASCDRPLSSVEGRYIYADFCKSEIRSLIPADDGASDDKPIAGLPTFGGISSFGQDTKGRIYFTDLASGGVYEIARRG